MLRNLTPGIRDLLPSLMGGAVSLGDDEFPGSEVVRPVCAQSGTLSTYLIPANFPGSPRKWYPADLPQYPLRQDNEVELLIDGEATYEAMVEAIETATGPGHFIVLIGWAIHLDFQLSKTGSRTPSSKRTAEAVFEERAKLGVKLRLLPWRNTKLTEGAPWNDVDQYGNYYCALTKKIADKWNAFAPDEVPRRSITIVDAGTRVAGSHHQKILLVYGEQGLVGFLGGVDFNSDRVNHEPVPVVAGKLKTLRVSGPLHDVHARVRGEAAEDLLMLAIDRWNYSEPSDVMSPFAVGIPTHYRDPGLNPPSSSLPATGREIEDLAYLLQLVRAKPARPPMPHYVVQIAQTVGNPELAKKQGNGVWPMIQQAIRSSQRFIYVEDQYFWSLHAATVLLEVIDRVRSIIVLTSSDDELSLLAAARHGMLCEVLKQRPDAWKKLGIYERIGSRHAYVHAKMSIFDDELVVVGSANWNDRGFTHDSEVVGAMADHPWDSPTGARFGNWHALELNVARALRMRLWAEHLGLPTDALADAVAAETYWRNPPAGASVRPYMVDGQLWHASRTVLESWYEQGGVIDSAFDPEAETGE